MTWHVSITGTTTAGKTVLVDALQELFQGVVVIPQATARAPRVDDNPNYFRFFDKERFEEQSFAARYKSYGVLESDITRALALNRAGTMTMMVSGARELSALFDSVTGLKPFNILVRHTADQSAEMALLHRNLSNFFSGSDLEQRLASNGRLCEECFFNPRFIARNIHLVLERGKPLAAWLKAISDSLFGPGRPDEVFHQAAGLALAKAVR